MNGVRVGGSEEVEEGGVLVGGAFTPSLPPDIRYYGNTAVCVCVRVHVCAHECVRVCVCVCECVRVTICM